MAINKVPNNYYNDTNIRRDKINTIIDHVNELDTHAVVPTPAAGDTGKVVKVGTDGYELASDEGLPSVDVSDSTRLLQVSAGNWTKTLSLSGRCFITTNHSGYINSTQDSGAYIIVSGSEITRYLLGQPATHQALLIFNSNRNLLATIVIESNKYSGFLYRVVGDEAVFYCVDTSNNPCIITIGSTTYSVTPITDIKYIDVTASGGVVTLPQDVTYADIVALVTAGVNVQLRQTLTSSYRYFHLMAYDETSGLYFENSYFAATELSIKEIHLNETISEMRYKTITFNT